MCAKSNLPYEVLKGALNSHLSISRKPDESEEATIKEFLEVIDEDYFPECAKPGIRMIKKLINEKYNFIMCSFDLEETLGTTMLVTDGEKLLFHCFYYEGFVIF